MNSGDWEPVLLDICCEIAQDVPYVLEILDKLDLDKGIQARVNDIEKDEKTEKHYEISIREIEHKDRGKSHYVPGLSYEVDVANDNKDSSELLPSTKYTRELGGCILLYGPLIELKTLRPIMSLLIFASCHLKLEDTLFDDLLITREAHFPSYYFRNFSQRHKRVTHKVNKWW